jgi:hypothetical protein
MEKFSKFLEDYSEWKAKNHPGKELDEYDMAFVRESYSKAVKAEEKALKEAKDLSDVEGSMTNVLSAHKNEINKLKTKAEIVDYVTNLFDKEKINTKASNRLLTTLAKAKSDKDAVFAMYNSILKGAGDGVIKESTEETVENKEEAPLKETEFQKALKAFAEFKESKGLGPVTRSERVRIFEKTRSEKSRMVENKITVKGVFDKLAESKKCVALAQKRLSEGDVMGAADATMAAGTAVTGAEADANAMATPAAPVPQEVVDQISQVKTAVDALAAQAGIASPVDMGAEPNAGVPAVTGAPADPAAAPAPAAPVTESRIEASQNRIAEGKDEQAKPAIEIPSEKELVKGVATGASNEAKPADTWPTKPLNEVPVGKKLGNVEESTETTAEPAKDQIKESEEFTPDADAENKVEESTEANAEADKIEESKEEAPAQMGLAEQRLEAELAKRNFKWGDFLKSGFNKR